MDVLGRPGETSTGCNDVSARTVAPCDAVTASGTWHHDPIVDKGDLRGVVASTRIDVLEACPDFGEVPNTGGEIDIPETEILRIAAMLEIFEKVCVKIAVDDVNVDVVNLATTGGRIIAALIGPAAVGLEAEVNRNVRAVQVLRSQVADRAHDRHDAGTIPALNIRHDLTLVPVAQEGVIVPGLRIVDQGGRDVYRGDGTRVRHGLAELDELVPAVAVTPSRIIITRTRSRYHRTTPHGWRDRAGCSC